MRRGGVVAVVVIAVVLLALFSWTRYAEEVRAEQLARKRPAEHSVARPTQAVASAPPASKPIPHIALASSSPNHPLRPLPSPGAPLKDILPALKAQAAEGDAAAACRIAFELDRCTKLPHLRNSPSFWETALDQLTAESRAKREWFVANARRNLAQAEAACEGLAPEELFATSGYALAGALAGNRQARWLAVNAVGLDAFRPERTLEGWATWRDHIRTIMEQGIAAGDPRILRIASGAHLRPYYGFRVFDRDPVQGVALQMAVARSSSPAYRAEHNNVTYVAGAEALTGEQMDAARRIAATISIAQAPEGGIDWSRGMGPSSDGTECERER